MGDERLADSWEESEFGLGEGMIDPGERATRSLPLHQQMAEIYSLPKTFDGSMPDRPAVEDTPVPRLAPGEKEADRG